MAGTKKKNEFKVGMKVGIYTLIKRAEDFEGMSDIRPQWLVICDCGFIKTKVNRYIKRNKYCSYNCGLRYKR